MLVIVGLGNLGEKFKNTRHNTGFMAVDFFAQKNDLPDFVFSKKYHALTSRGSNVVLAKPQTFMNESGQAVKKIMAQHKGAGVVVVHDDIDLPLGKIKIVASRGSAGHKGVESIIQHIGNQKLVRFRIGIQPASGKPNNAESFVIKNFTKGEKEAINGAIEKTAEALDFFLEHGLEKTMNEYNR